MDSSNHQIQEPDDKYIQFAYSLAHDLRGSLSFIKGYSEYLLIADGFDSFNDSQQESLEKISHHADRAFDTLETYIKLSKIESGFLLVEQVPVDLISVLKDVVKELQTKIESQNRTLKIYAPDTIPVVRAKPYEVHKIFFDLIETAYSCSSSEEQIIISFSSNENTVRTTIKSESCSGKKPARAYPPSFGKFGIIRRYIEQFGGEFGEEDEESKGSTIWFTLPIADQPATQE